MKVTKKTRLLGWEPIFQTSDGQVKLKSVTDNGQAEAFKWGDIWRFDGQGFSGTPNGWFVEFVMVRPSRSGEYIDCSRDLKSAKLLEAVAPNERKPEPGVYPDAVLDLSMAYTDQSGEFHTEGKEIPIRLIVE